MSFKVMNWAAEQKTGSPTHKLVLLVLADFAGEVGQSHYSNAKIAEICEMSVDTVQRAMSRLEATGLIARIPQRRKDGSRGTNLIICLFNASAWNEAYRNGWSGHCETPEKPHAADCGPPAADCGDPTAPSPVPHRTKPGTPPQLCGSQIDPSDNHQVITPYPHAEAVASAGKEPGLSFDEFEKAFGFDETMPLTPARKAFANLCERDKALAIEFAPAYASACARQKALRAKPHSWLRQRGWEIIAKKRGNQPAANGGDQERVWVPKDSPRWAAIEAKIGRSLPVKERNGEPGWNVLRSVAGIDLPPPASSFIEKSCNG